MLFLFACAPPPPDAPAGAPIPSCPQPAATVLVEVHDAAGAPMSGVQVGVGEEELALAGRTDALGQLRVAAPAHARLGLPGLASEPEEACAADRVFVVAGAEDREVWVHDRAGAPVEGAEIVAEVPTAGGHQIGRASCRERVS
jgi:hypothetical protein